MTGITPNRIPWGAAAVRLGVRQPHSPVDVLLLDSRDSFTFNLAHQCAALGATVDVVDADDVSADAVIAARADGVGPRLVILGPGPRGPRDLPHLVELVRRLDGTVPLFGVCLGLQVLVHARGGAVGRARHAVHGKRDAIVHDDVGCLAGLPSPLWVMRYHSLVAVEVPSSLQVTARDAVGDPMALFDPIAHVEAVQFHPESIGTAGGTAMMMSALRRAGVAVDVTARYSAVPPSTSLGPGFSGPTPAIV